MATVTSSNAYVVDPKRDRLVITASALGTVFEWYDFFLYGILAALLGKLFFPTDNPTAATLASLAAFGAGFGVRPLGALLFGWFGDRVGRKYTFLITITLMGGATAAIGFLPTFATAGLWAPRCWYCSACCRGWHWAVNMAAPPFTSRSMPLRASAGSIPAGSRSASWAASCSA